MRQGKENMEELLPQSLLGDQENAEPNPAEQIQQTDKDHKPQHKPLINIPTLEEIDKAIKALKTTKAPGFDKIP